MMGRDPLSDEMLCAYLDGELASPEREQVRDLLARDATLRARAQAMQDLRGRIRDAYSEVSPPARETPEPRLPHLRRALAAGIVFAVGLSAGWFGKDLLRPSDNPLMDMARQVAMAQPAHNQDEWRLVLHITTDDTYKLNNVLNEAEKILREQQAGGQKVRLTLLTNGRGLNLMRADTSHFAKRLLELQKKYDTLTLKACQLAIDRVRKEKGIDVTMLPGVQVVPSAMGEIIKRQHEGWTYIRI